MLKERQSQQASSQQPCPVDTTIGKVNSFITRSGPGIVIISHKIWHFFIIILDFYFLK